MRNDGIEELTCAGDRHRRNLSSARTELQARIDRSSRLARARDWALRPEAAAGSSSIGCA